MQFKCYRSVTILYFFYYFLCHTANIQNPKGRTVQAR